MPWRPLGEDMDNTGVPLYVGEKVLDQLIPGESGLRRGLITLPCQLLAEHLPLADLLLVAVPYFGSNAGRDRLVPRRDGAAGFLDDLRFDPVNDGTDVKLHHGMEAIGPIGRTCEPVAALGRQLVDYFAKRVSRHMVTLVDHHHTPEIRPAGKIPPAQGLHQADGEPLADAFLAPTNDADLFGTKAETGYSPITYLNKQVLFVRDPKYRLADP